MNLLQTFDLPFPLFIDYFRKGRYDPERCLAFFPHWSWILPYLACQYTGRNGVVLGQRNQHKAVLSYIMLTDHHHCRQFLLIEILFCLVHMHD